MKNRTKLQFICLLAIAAALLIQPGCSSQNASNTAPNQSAATASQTPGQAGEAMSALTTASPAADAAGGSNVAAPAAPPAGAANTPPQPNAALPAPEKPLPPRTFTLAAGTPITIYTASDLSTKSDKEGERFTASLARDIRDGDWLIAKRGAPVAGVVVNSDPGGKVKGRASIAVRLQSLELADGSTIDLSTGSYTKVAKSTKKKDAMKIGIGAGIGAAIGAIAGGGKGAAIGAGAGGGAGTGVVLATRGDPAVIPSESQLTFKLTEPVKVTKR